MEKKVGMRKGKQRKRERERRENWKERWNIVNLYAEKRKQHRRVSLHCLFVTWTSKFKMAPYNYYYYFRYACAVLAQPFLGYPGIPRT